MRVNGILLKKLEVLDQVLRELQSLPTIGVADLHSDWRLRRAAERDLQILVEVVIDVCQRLIAHAGERPATTSAGAIDACVALGVLDSAQPYRRMVQFRNLLVHRYEDIDVQVLADILRSHLQDFVRFRDQVLRYAQG
ncbi:MAG: type VII toxin-antitoxin system HepT family RNase toxin [Polyangiales bacterium]